jgi:DNA-binding XRE family transcriptional regulator
MATEHSGSLNDTLVDELRRARTLPPPSTARLIRVIAGATQEQLGHQLGVHRITVARWEAGTRKPRGSVRAAYADLLRQLRELA